MLFDLFRKKVTKQTIEMVRQPYAMLQQVYGIPPRFWEDEFVLGFFGSMIGLISRLLGGERLSADDKGQLLLEVFSALSNMNGIAMIRRFNELSFQQPRSDAFENGIDNAQIVTLAILGKVSAIGHGAVEEAKREAIALGSGGDVGALSNILTQKLFVQPIIGRFRTPSV